MSARARPPILDEIERKRKVAAILRSCLQPHGLKGVVDEHELHVRDEVIVEMNGNRNRMSDAVLDTMFPREAVPSHLYHYTSRNAFAGIAASGALHLFPVRKRINEGGELKAFAERHGLTGFLDTAKGEAFYKELSDDLFYTVLGRTPS